MPILFELKDHVARVTIDRPDVLNAIDAASERELQRIWSEIENNRDVRCVVLTGSGERAFSTGADMKGGSGASGLEYFALSRPGGFGGIALRDTLDVPVIARVNGHAMGGGAGLVACADYAIAVEGARFAFSETRLGIIPALISPYVLRAIGPGHTRALFTTGRAFDAAEAYRIGLVHRVVGEGELDAAVAEATADLLAAGPVAVAESKRLVRDATASLALDDLPRRIAALRVAPEGQEGLTAFVEKRKPGWVPDRSDES